MENLKKKWGRKWSSRQKLMTFNIHLITPTQYVVHTDHILHLVCIWECYFLAPHTHVLCMGSGSATGIFPAPRLVYSLLKYFFQISYVLLNSTLHYQIFRFDIDIQILVWEKFWSKSDMSTVNVSLLHEIHMGVGVHLMTYFFFPPPPPPPRVCVSARSVWKWGPLFEVRTFYLN